MPHKRSDFLFEHQSLDTEKDTREGLPEAESEDDELNQIADARKDQKRIRVSLDDL